MNSSCQPGNAPKGLWRLACGNATGNPATTSFFALEERWMKNNFLRPVRARGLVDMYISPVAAPLANFLCASGAF
ncbi:MAG: hypothetical protein AB1757_01050 [Acidobacteriota bacterium]